MFIEPVLNGTINRVMICMEINYKKIGFRISQKRRERNLKQKDLAELLDISPKYLSNLETGKKNVTIEMLINLCNILGETPDYFLLGTIRKDINSNLTDNLKLCSERDKLIIEELVQICARKKD